MIVPLRRGFVVERGEYLRKVISTVKLATLGEENLIREIVLPYADDVIKRASRPTKE